MVLFGDNFREVAEFQQSPTASNTKIKKQSKNQILLMRQKFYEKKTLTLTSTMKELKDLLAPKTEGGNMIRDSWRKFQGI